MSYLNNNNNMDSVLRRLSLNYHFKHHGSTSIAAKYKLIIQKNSSNDLTSVSKQTLWPICMAVLIAGRASLGQ